MTIDDAVRTRIHELLVEQNLSLAKISLLGGVTPSTLYDFMNGTTVHIQLNTLKQISQGFQMTLTEFFNKNYFNCIE